MEWVRGLCASSMYSAVFEWKKNFLAVGFGCVWNPSWAWRRVSIAITSYGSSSRRLDRRHSARSFFFVCVKRAGTCVGWEAAGEEVSVETALSAFLALCVRDTLYGYIPVSEPIAFHSVTLSGWCVSTTWQAPSIKSAVSSTSSSIHNHLLTWRVEGDAKKRNALSGIGIPHPRWLATNTHTHTYLHSGTIVREFYSVFFFQSSLCVVLLNYLLDSDVSMYLCTLSFNPILHFNPFEYLGYWNAPRVKVVWGRRFILL